MSAPCAKPRPPLPAGPFLVVGLARSGVAVAELLAGRGESVRGCDAGRPAGAEGLAAAGVEVSLDTDGVELLDGVTTVVKSPGVPQEAPAVAGARERGLAVLGELEIAWRLVPNRFVAVTGTNGKTTTAELLGHVYRTAGLPVGVAGNVGQPVASLAGRLAPEATVVCEASSFQLEDAESFAPECAVFLNFAPDHLDRHPSLDAYLAAKLRIFANQTPDDVAVAGADEPALAGRDLGGRARRLTFGEGRRGEGGDEVTISDGAIYRGGEAVLEAGELGLLGSHNLQNAAAATAAAAAMGVEVEPIREGLRGFAGLPHRLERVATRGGVLYVNDSKATNVAAALVGLRSFAGGVHAILGGSLKGEGFAGLAPAAVERCRACYLIGEAAERLAEDLAPAEAAGVELHRSESLEAAVRAAAAAARPGEAVLLSPACASFDAYRDFEQRGDCFRAIVEALG